NTRSSSGEVHACTRSSSASSKTSASISWISSASSANSHSGSSRPTNSSASRRQRPRSAARNDRACGSAGLPCIAGVDVLVDQGHELGGDVLALERDLLLAVDEYRGRGRLAGTRQGDS